MKEKGQKYSSLRKKIFLASFIPALIVCILAAVIQASHLSSGITYIGLAVILAIVLVISVTFSQNAAKPVNAIAYAVRELKKGHIHARCSIKTNDDIGQIAQDIDSFADNYEKNIIGTLQNIADGKFSDQIQTVDKDDIASLSAKNAVLTINSIVSEVKTVVNAAADGDFSVRCNQDKFKGAWKTLACDTNEFCESSSSTLNEISTIINKYSVNDFDLRMKNEYKGIFQAVANDLNVHGDLINRFEKLIIQISDGDLSQMDYIEKIGRLSESDKFLPAICKMMRAVYELTNEVNYLSDEAVNGNILNIRGDTDKFSGCYKNIVSGFNATLDAISAPLLEAFKVLTKTAVGDFTEEFEGDYKGEFDNLAKAVKGIQSNFKIIYKAVSMISKGDLSMLEKLKTAGKMSENDVMVPAFITLMESVTLLINESTRIADAAAGGNLNLRCDTSKAGGVFENILESINSLLDKVEKPTVEITHKMEQISNGYFGDAIEGEFSGQFKELVDAVNKTTYILNYIIKNISDNMAQMCEGNYNLIAIENYPGDLEAVSGALNTIINSSNELYRRVGETTSQVAEGAAQVSQGSQLLSQGATEQASAVEQLSATVMEIATRTKQNAADAGKAKELAKVVKENAKNGNMQMDEMLKSMNDISESSISISKIIKVIDDIAFQTNILSLNAAVEAARAGQYGKGFAVVADEVRNLAAKSASAAKDTTSLIETSIKRVDVGTKIAKETAASFSGIVDGVEKTAAIVSEIADSSNEQATGISQINKGLEQVSQVIQTNSATAEESAAASEELSSQAATLNQQLSLLKLRDSNYSSSEDVRLKSGGPETTASGEPTLSFGKY